MILDLETARNVPDPHLGRWQTARASALAVVAFAVSVAADHAIVGAATADQHHQLTVASIAAVFGLVASAVAHLRLRRGARASTVTRPPSPVRLLTATALGMVVIRGMPQLVDLVDHVLADRDEPLTTMVHLVRLVLTASLATGLAVFARREHAVATAHR